MSRTTDDVLPAGTLSEREQPSLSGDDILLRPWTGDDSDVVATAFTDPDIGRWHLRRVTTPEDAHRWIDDRRDAWRNEHAGSWAVTDPHAQVLGQVALRGINLAMGVTQVSYWVLPDARRRGIATDSLRTLTSPCAPAPTSTT